MTDQKVTPWFKTREDVGDNLALGFDVEVKEDVSQENDFEVTDGGRDGRGEVDLPELETSSQFGDDFQACFCSSTVFVKQGGWDAFDAIRRILTGACFGKHLRADVGANHFPR